MKKAVFKPPGARFGYWTGNLPAKASEREI